MAVHSPPIWLQAGSYAASEDRQLIRAILSGAGVKRTTTSTTEMQVTQTSTPSMNLNVATGYAFVGGDLSPSLQGTYVVYNDATDTVTLTAANASLPRIDLIVVSVKDSAFSGAADSAQFEVIAGTPASSPSPPAAPANSVALAQVLVGAGVTSVDNSKITDTRIFVSPLNYWAAPTASVPALRLFARSGQTGDIFRVESAAYASYLSVGSDGTVYLSSGAQLVATSMRPTITAESGSSTSTTGAATAISGGPTGTFVAPKSGCIKLSLSGFVKGDSGGAYGTIAIELRTGSTVGSGTTVNLGLASVTSSSNNWIKASGFDYLSGLTPGATYNFRVAVTRTVAAGTAYGSTSKVMIEPVA